MTVADDHLARIGSVLSDWDRETAASASYCVERLPDCAREDLALREALEPVMGIMIKLGVGQAPGAEATEDASWAASVALARRNVLVRHASGIDHGLAGGTLRLLDRIDSLIGVWPGDEWGGLVQSRVQELVDAAQRGRQRGWELRQNRQHTDPDDPFNIGWLLRHPTDHYLRRAAATVTDPQCDALIDAQIAKLALSYQQLCGLDWTPEETAADAVVEMQVIDDHAGGWTKPASAIVITQIKGDAPLDEQIAVRLVKDADAPFNGTVVSLLADERWLTCARVLEDGTVLPLDGTRRCAEPRL